MMHRFQFRSLDLVVLSCLLFGATGCGGKPGSEAGNGIAPVANGAAPPSASEEKPPESAVTDPAAWGQLQNVHQVDPDLYCGSAPESEADYEALTRQGIRTLIRIDGIPPDVMLADDYGLEVIHFPMPFQELEAQILPVAQAAQAVNKPVYVCCQYGKPRAPAVAAMISRTLTNWNAERAMAFAQGAGVSENYGGIVKSLQIYSPPGMLPPWDFAVPFPQSTDTSPLVTGMTAILLNWDPIRTWKENGLVLKNAGELRQLREHAVQTAEVLQQLRTDPEAKEYGDDFLAILNESSAAATALARTLGTARTPLTDEVNSSLLEQIGRVGNTCSQCHKDYRN